jgi:hypothetical protein
MPQPKSVFMLAGNRGRRTCAATAGRPRERGSTRSGVSAQRQRGEPVHRHRPAGGLHHGWAGAVAVARLGLGSGACALVAGTAQKLGHLGLHGGLDQQPGDILQRLDRVTLPVNRASISARIRPVGDPRPDTGVGPSLVSLRGFEGNLRSSSFTPVLGHDPACVGPAGDHASPRRVTPVARWPHPDPSASPATWRPGRRSSPSAGDVRSPRDKRESQAEDPQVGGGSTPPWKEATRWRRRR